MAGVKKSKTIKKVTEIPNASVTIEVEETSDEVNNPSKAIPNNSSEENPQEVSESDSSEGTSWKKVFLIILLVVPIGFLMFGGFLYFSKNFNPNFLNKEPEKSIKLPEATPIPTKAEVDKKAYEIEVQNGSGIAGEGARVKEVVEKAGFKVGAVGNATTSDYTETIIKVNEDVPVEYIDELTKTLEERGPVAKIEKFALGEDGEVLVIVGNQLSSASPTPEDQ